ncbi:MAG TPA: type IV pilus biogenesis/stability protein PilW [Thioalkalivibrio sp.]|nr:type IV pilus biogenesis/stability protein PilW [Thioalkalivibrio sp.]
MTMTRLPRWILLLCLTLAMLVGCAGQPTSESRDRDREAASINVDLGLHYLGNNNMEQARVNLSRALEIDPGYSQAHSAYALFLTRLNNPESAETHFRRALELQADDSFTWNNYASFLCQQERYPEAQKAFEKALENPFYLNPAQALTNAGVCMQQTGEMTEAEEYFRRALDNNPQYPPALMEMARLTYQAERYLQTRAFLQRFTSNNDHTAESLWLCYRSELAMGNREGAGNCSIRLKERFPDSRQAAALMEIERRAR